MKRSMGRVSVRARFANMAGRAVRAIGRLIEIRRRKGVGLKPGWWRAVHDPAPGQWHRWYAANARNRRQLRAWKQASGVRLDPTKVDLPRWSVP